MRLTNGVDGRFQKVANRITVRPDRRRIDCRRRFAHACRTTFRIWGYPGLAIIFFLAAAACGVALLINILFYDNRTADDSCSRPALSGASARRLSAVATRFKARSAAEYFPFHHVDAVAQFAVPDTVKEINQQPNASQIKKRPHVQRQAEHHAMQNNTPSSGKTGTNGTRMAAGALDLSGAGNHAATNQNKREKCSDIRQVR